MTQAKKAKKIKETLEQTAQWDKMFAQMVATEKEIDSEKPLTKKEKVITRL